MIFKDWSKNVSNINGLFKKINSENILETLKVAHLHNLDNLFNGAMNKLKNGMKPTNQNDWNAFLGRYPDLATKVTNFLLYQ